MAEYVVYYFPPSRAEAEAEAEAEPRVRKGSLGTLGKFETLEEANNTISDDIASRTGLQGALDIIKKVSLQWGRYHVFAKDESAKDLRASLEFEEKMKVAVARGGFGEPRRVR